ncbi:hypothetical protein [Lactococcus petauri]|uniref:hypothetical protein n=1 Tax=Lactococcus petauri TaxID=1940789 RepID=UPI0022E6956E|nr:hypothetical protein [Lactococcus petauri]
MTETIKYGEFFELIFSGKRIEIKALNTNKANADDIISITAEVVDQNEAKEPVLDDGMFYEKDWALEIRAVVKKSRETGILGLNEYKKVIGEAQKLIDFMYENSENFIAKLGFED